MRPYFAIIKDSFREALASRVLWVLLVLITVLLVALIPFHWRSNIAAKLIAQDIRNPRNLAASLQAGQERDATALQKHLWNSLSKDMQNRINQVTVGQGPPAFVVREELAEDLNRLIQQDDFFQEELWSSAKLSERAEELIAQSRLDGDALAQLNRLALEAAVPGQLSPCPDEAMMFRYAKWDMDFVPTFSRRIAIERMDTFVLVPLMAIFVGFFGIFAAVLVTAPIIPNMLDSGSLYVLLSKPIARPLLFLAKFLGGCSFVLINASYLIAGLWLILGFRFGIWKPQVLWSIPIFLFTFAIFYSVSALSGLIWRSTVMAIVATILFWVACKAVGFTTVFEQLFISPQKISDVLKQDGQLFVSRANGQVAKWNSDTNMMEDIFEARENEQLRGPRMMMGRNTSIRGMVYDSANEQLVALSRKWGPQGDILVGKKSEGWTRKVTSAAPQNAAALLWHHGAPIAIANGGVYRISTETLESRKQEINIFGLKIPGPPPQELHEHISEGITDRLPADARVAFDPTAGDVFIHGGRRLRTWQQNDRDLFREGHRVDVELDQVTDISAGAGIVVLATMDDRVKLHLFDAASLQQQKQLDTDSETGLRKLAVSRDGRWIATLFENDRLELIDLQDDRRITRLPSQGAIADVEFEADALLIADANDRVVSASLPELTIQAVVAPSQPLINKLFRYLVKPLYLIFPKPAELQNTMQYAITGKDTMEMDSPGMGSGRTTIKLNPWQPMISNSAFIGVMLLIGCIYVYRQDF